MKNTVGGFRGCCKEISGCNLPTIMIVETLLEGGGSLYNLLNSFLFYQVDSWKIQRMPLQSDNAWTAIYLTIIGIGTLLGGVGLTIQFTLLLYLWRHCRIE